MYSNYHKSFDLFIKDVLKVKDLKEYEIYIMCHRGSLSDSLKTKILIYDCFMSLDFLNSIKNLYEFYGYDERINCYRFITKNMKTINPTWLLLTDNFKEWKE